MIDMEKNIVLGSGTTSRYLSRSLAHAALERITEDLKWCGRVSVTTKTDDGPELCYFPVNVPY